MDFLKIRKNPLLTSATFLAAMVVDPRFNTEDSCAINNEQSENAIVSILN